MPLPSGSEMRGESFHSLQLQRNLFPPFSIEGALTPTVLAQYFRSFLIRLNLLENQLGLLGAAGSR